MALPDPSDLTAAIAATRFGLGARPGEIAATRGDPRGFLKAQIRAEGADQPSGNLGDTAQNLMVFQALRKDRKALRAEDAAAELKQVQAQIRDLAISEMVARGRLAATTPAAFRERWTLFWSNHFTVSATKGTVAPIAGAFEREAIRPHVFGRFEDMLTASSQHPAMLLYLDQAASIGPDSPAGRNAAGRQRQAGLNENLAREIMELHTVGVNGGYTQADVTEFARALTGWSISRAQEGARGGRQASAPGYFMFRPFAHEPGERRILGRSYPQEGYAQGRVVLADLAAHPATARHIARKLAIHFIADDPPAALTDRLEKSFVSTGGRLDKLAETLIDSPEAWAPAAAKFKTPYEFLVSSWRVSGATPDLDNPNRFVGSLTALGQRPFQAPSPKGWPDEAAEWASPDGVVKRIAWAEAAGKVMANNLDPLESARSALGARLTPEAATAISRAETRPEAFAILLMSPEFQRR
jgi:uncharacterized protein (DUF1800 family)